MLPVLFSIGPFTFYTFGIFICLAIFLGLFVVWKRGRELHYEEKELFDVTMKVIFWGVVGARIGYVLMHIQDYLVSTESIIHVITRPGWYFPVGLIFASFATAYQAKKNKWDKYQLMDIFATALVLAQALISLGTFFAGTGYGIPTTSSIGIQFAGLYDKRYPIQLWETVAFAFCFGYLWWVEGVYRTFSWYRKSRSQASTGFIVSMYLIWWGFISLVATLFRTPELVVNGIRLDVLAPIGVGIGLGLWTLFSRSGSSSKSLLDTFLDYFGLNIKEKTREKRMKAIKEALENTN